MKMQFFPTVRMMVAVLFLTVVVATQSSALAGEIVLQDDKLSVAFDSDSGALKRLEDKSTRWVIECQPELGVSFQLNALLPDRSNNLVSGQKQHAVEVTKISNNEVRLQWKNLVSEHGETLPMTLTAVVTLTNGVLTFAATLENDSPLMVESIDYPYFGALCEAPDGVPLVAKHMWYDNLQSQEISQRVAIMSKQSLFCLIQSPREALYA